MIPPDIRQFIVRQLGAALADAWRQQHEHEHEPLPASVNEFREPPKTTDRDTTHTQNESRTA